LCKPVLNLKTEPEMANVVEQNYDTTMPSINLGQYTGQRVYSIDPKMAMQSMNNRNTSQNNHGLMSPSYSEPPLGSVLQTPKDTTPTRIKLPSSKPLSSEWSSLPKVPQKKHLLNYGTVAPAETIDRVVSLDDFMNEIPMASQIQPQVHQTHQEKVDEAKFRANYRVKFSILRDAYPQMEVPEPRDDQSQDEIKAMYDQYVRRIIIDQSVEQSNVYLLILWLIIEVIGGRFFKLPLKGYTKNQFKYMRKYRMLLVELGERNQSAGIADGWPIEIRILAMAAFNGVIFVLVQMLANRVGMDGDTADSTANQLREMINDFLTQNKGTDVLRRAAEADADHVPPPDENEEPPMGGMGNMLANLAGMFSGGGGEGLGGLANLFGGANKKPAEKPQKKKPTTFGSRRKK